MGVNLDALIPREDFATDSSQTAGTLDNTISIHHLTNNAFFLSSLRKPDFQRETANWSPAKVVELIAAFLDGDLIPAIILWRSGQYSFVIDGAHRLSAMLSWIYDDYGDRRRSLNFFENQIPEEQIKLAEATRKLVQQQIGTYAMYEDAARDMFNAPEELRKRLGNLAQYSFVAQWVPSVDSEAAQNSFFKINQSPTPIDQTERRILKARRSAAAIATRAINRAGSGHRYWGAFDSATRSRIESLGKEINTALYLPPLGGMPIKSSDVPVAGRGYSALPFLFDLVTLTNSVQIKDSTSSGKSSDQLKEDADGRDTIAYLESVKKVADRITTTSAGSLGLHPLVYFYTRGGTFQPIAFLATIKVIERLIASGDLNRFTSVRAEVERFLMEHKEAFTLIVKRQGSGARSRPAIEAFLMKVISGFWDGKNGAEVLDSIAQDARFAFIAVPQPIRSGNEDGDKRFSAATKTAAFVTELINNGVKCGICGALVHRNSMQTDHVVRKAEGGGAHAGNAQLSHPYCNTTYKEQAAKAEHE
jgi:hypothetical protein